jgi:NAD(P)H-hydrate epimerase
MKVATAEQMRAIDRRAMEEYGIPGVVLMEAAGSAFARGCVEEMGGRVRDRRIAIYCGPGNNGGDGFVAARHLANAGADVIVFLCGSATDLRGDAATHFAPLRRMPVRIHENAEPAPAGWRADLIGDAVLGTGAHGPIDVASPVGALVSQVGENTAGAPIVSADIPSGVDADSGEADPLAVRAARTVTFALMKPGLLQYPGIAHAGRVTVADIGIPRSILSGDALSMELTTADIVRAILPRRSESRDSNKGSYGSLLVIAGSAGMAGAAVLSAVSALRAGAGLVQLAVPESLLDIAATLAPEIILRPLPETSERTHGGKNALEAALRLAEKADAVALGPGMGATEAVVRFVQDLSGRLLSSEMRKPLVVDADGLNALALEGSRPAPAGTAAQGTDPATPFVLTPHPGEMGRLLGSDSKSVQADRLASVRACTRRYGATALLKGARTLIAADDGRVAFNRIGSVALATAGSGDVLTGVIGALLANKLNAYDAARVGAYLHALAGKRCEIEIGAAGVLSGDVRDRLPEARELLYGSEPLDEL